MQALVLERVYAIPFGVSARFQAVRSDVGGFEPFAIPRMANVWFNH
jgi:peptide/nickel transport system substrate-binding protein